MKRCPTAFLTCGWLLMTAPLDQDGNKVRTQLPLSQWSHKASFDTAQECEAAISEAGLVLQALNQKAEKEGKPAHLNPNWPYYTPRALGRCIPSDAMQLK